MAESLDLDSILVTDQLHHRPPHTSDPDALNRALIDLMRQMTRSPQAVLQSLVEAAQRLCQAHSAGISLLEEADGGRQFRWNAITGPLGVHQGQTMPRQGSPCGVVLDRDKMLMMRNLGRHFPDFAQVQPPMVESLLVPFYVDGRPCGTIWVVAHDDSKQFDPEDARVLEQLSQCAAVAYQALRTRDELTRARDVAEAANRSKELFIATLSHELRTPLNAMLSWVQLLQEEQAGRHGCAPGEVDPEDLREGLQVIERNLEAEARLMDDLLDVSRIATGKLRIELGDCNLSEVIHAALATVRPAAELKGIHLLHPSPPASLRPVQADTIRMRQIVWNLLTNAVKFTPPGGTVRVDLRQDERQTHIEVADTGPGLPKGVSLFEPYSQGDPQAIIGLGLGLSIIKKLAELHGGTVQARNGKQGGAVFTVTLPNLQGTPDRLAARQGGG